MCAALGPGIASFPFAIAANGLIFGSILIILGAIVSYFSGMLLVVVQMKTGKDRYEDMARSLFSKKVERIVSIMNVICQMSFAVSYIVFTKETVPFIIEACGGALPWWCGQS